ncbi:MAG: dephospho-CoA kinase [Gammaproteobacteria bacterium]|nr:dephospho-CoA kinase [Gammaproteobacteria bacterium]
MNAPRSTIVGLTGGIASGKSTAAQYLGRLGARVVDCDRLGHRAYDPGTPSFDAVRQAFGAEVVGEDGCIDRRALGGRVFGNPAEMKKLTDIVWPEIGRLARAEMAAAPPGGITVLEAAVLFEAGWLEGLDEIWVVVADPETAVARTMARDGLDEAAVRMRIDSQLSDEERAARADVVIDNSASLHDLHRQLDAHWQRLLEPRRAS